MSEHRRDSAHEEAAAWFARLGHRSVTTQSLREFRAWRRSPANAAAYAEMEALWSRSGALRGDPDIRAATEAALGRRPLRRRLAAAAVSREGLAWSLAGLALVALLAVALAPMLVQPTYATGVGELRMVVLRDGSRVRLNTDSQVKVQYRGGERRILLQRGQAYFEAARDPQRPFVVDAGSADVRALGTKFDVRRDGQAVQVTLVEGAVRVHGEGQARDWTLAPSQQLVLSASGRAAVQRVADTARLTSWTTGRLVFQETPLGQAVAEMNRYTPHKVELEAAGLSAAPVSGVFDTGDTAAFVSAVAVLFDLQAVRAPDGSLRLKSRPA